MGNMWFYDMLIYCVSFITRVPIYPGWPHTNRPSLVIMYYFYWDILLWPWNTHLLYIHLPIVCHCEWSHKSTIIAFMVHLFLGPYIYIYTHIHTWILYIYIILLSIYLLYIPPLCLTFKSPCGWHPTRLVRNEVSTCRIESNWIGGTTQRRGVRSHDDGWWLWIEKNNLCWCFWNYPLVNVYITIENHHAING